MFGILKCFGGGWGVICTVDNFQLANEIVSTLRKQKGGMNCKTIATSEGLYSDMLHNDFETITGLAQRL